MSKTTSSGSSRYCAVAGKLTMKVPGPRPITHTITSITIPSAQAHTVRNSTSPISVFVNVNLLTCIRYLSKSKNWGIESTTTINHQITFLTPLFPHQGRPQAIRLPPLPKNKTENNICPARHDNKKLQHKTNNGPTPRFAVVRIPGNENTSPCPPLFLTPAPSNRFHIILSTATSRYHGHRAKIPVYHRYCEITASYRFVSHRPRPPAQS
ncbi:hypothetical protein B0H67DRAFT_47947 [Lasiosphaeris hirsuta]|uniref:Uncharacterized protein n=1 Tax=Lasiosphaeris hirsuta TaxID=260670 RepID=A0AA40BAJ6_9PEZI|nr:hypothetical protein B0H67DRAFT_47947 [Lasiosphaeris hirsuta]